MLTIMIPAVRQLKTSESLLITSSTRNQASLETSLITMHLLGLINFLPPLASAKNSYDQYTTEQNT